MNISHTSKWSFKQLIALVASFVLPLLILFGGVGVVMAQHANEFQGVSGTGESDATQHANEFQGLDSSGGTSNTSGPNPHDSSGSSFNTDNPGGSSFNTENPGGSSPTGLINPLKANTIPQLLFAILDILLIFAYPVVIFFIIYAGFKFVTAQGDTGKLAEARSAFMWAVVGGVIVLGAELLVTVIQGTVDAFKR